ncbi:signal peptidase II, partial [Planctomycetota bacterium]
SIPVQLIQHPQNQGKRSRLMTVSLGLFAAGVAGNLHDRAFLGGRVRDFIDVYIGEHHWPTFNVADSLLCIAVGLLLISNLFAGKTQSESQA